MFGSLLIIYLIVVTFFLLGVNNIYRIKLIFRTIFCAHNAAELDELLHTNPTYRRPIQSQRVVIPQRSPSNYSTINPLASCSQNNLTPRINPLNYLINKPANFLTAANANLDQSFEPATSSYNDDLSPII